MALCNTPVFEDLEAGACCGCESCVDACPVGIISMQENACGFLYPYMDKDKCIRCKKCLSVCPALRPPQVYTDKCEVYAGYADQDALVYASSSGGFFSLIAGMFLQDTNASVAGVVFQEGFKGVHHVCSEDTGVVLQQMRGSKYVQSKKNGIYNAIEEKVKIGERVLFVGCPCEVAGLRKYLKENDTGLYCIDLVCQGPTSPRAMREYMDEKEKRYRSPIHAVNFRYVGSYPWIPQWLKIDFENGRSFKKLFYDTSLGAAVHVMQRESCHQCTFAGPGRMGDLSLGDFHGADPAAPYYNRAGVSIAMVNTEKGRELFTMLEQLKPSLYPVAFDLVAKPNPRLHRSTPALPEYDIFCEIFSTKGLDEAAKQTIRLRRRMVNALPSWVHCTLDGLTLRRKRDGL